MASLYFLSHTKCLFISPADCIPTAHQFQALESTMHWFVYNNRGISQKQQENKTNLRKRNPKKYTEDMTNVASFLDLLFSLPSFSVGSFLSRWQYQLLPWDRPGTNISAKWKELAPIWVTTAAASHRPSLLYPNGPIPSFIAQLTQQEWLLWGLRDLALQVGPW